MKLIRDLASLPFDWPGCVAAIGNFDGVHEGHQYLFNELISRAKSMHLPAVLICFEPPPPLFFNQPNFVRLSSFREKIRLMQRFDIDWVIALRFNQKFAKQIAHSFVEHTLVNTLKVEQLWVGKDFRFGHKRTGDVSLLQTVGKQVGFSVQVIEDITIGGERVSSTGIRKALKAGDLSLAERLLGYSYRITGRVVKGAQRGRQWGVPTANIDLSTRGLPLTGVFVVEVYGISEQPLKGVANCGVRPTVDGLQPMLEVHCFDFDQEFYGQRLEVVFTHKIRDEIKFSNIDRLKAQIMNDIDQAKALLNNKELS